MAAHQITTHVNSIAETTGCKRLNHKTEVSSSVWAERQIRLRCLEGLDEAVLLTVSEVNEVIFNREVIICHNGATEQTAAPLDQILPNTVHRVCRKQNSRQYIDTYRSNIICQRVEDNQASHFLNS